MAGGDSKESENGLPVILYVHEVAAGQPLAVDSTVKTGPDGRFQLRGAGRERIVSILIQGPKIETRVVQVMTRVGPSNSIRFPRPQPGQMAMDADILIYAIGFEHVAGPGRNVEGDVVDAATGQPVPGVVIRPKMVYPGAFDNPYPLIRWRSEMSRRVTTDGRGHYRLGGLPVGRPVELGTRLSDQMTYRPMFQELPNAPGVGAARLDFKLARGIPVHGKVTNRTTGKPVAAFVEYRPTLENPNLSSSNDVNLFDRSRRDPMAASRSPHCPARAWWLRP